MAAQVYYSVCPFGTGDIKTGTPNISITSGVATLTPNIAQIQNSGITQIYDTVVTEALTGVVAGSLLVACLYWEGDTGTGNASVSDGTSTFSACTRKDHSNGDQHSQIHYLLSANSGNKTYTATGPAGTTFMIICVYEFSHTGVVALETQNGNYGANTPISTGNVSPAGAALCIATCGYYTSTTYSSSQINGNAADANVADAYFNSWFDVISSGFTNGAGAKGYGISLYNDSVYSFQTDCGGAARGSAGTWDIGAFEYFSATITLIQEGFRFRNDDGSETAATWAEAEDTGITLPSGNTIRLRLIIDATGASNATPQLEYRLQPPGNSWGNWTKVT